MSLRGGCFIIQSLHPSGNPRAQGRWGHPGSLEVPRASSEHPGPAGGGCAHGRGGTAIAQVPAPQTIPWFPRSALPLSLPSVTSPRAGGTARAVGAAGATWLLALPPALAPMALLGLLVLLALAGPVWATWDTCRGTCGLRPMAFDHSSTVPEDNSQDEYYEPSDASDDTTADKGDTGVHPGAWPGVISIQATLDNGTWHMCAGALIHPQWVLTVASCFYEAGDISRWEVVIGATDLSQPGPEAELRHIQRLLVHRNYIGPTARDNIALLELEQPVQCSDYIQLACVPDSALAVPELRTCYIAGWRATPDSAPSPRLVLQEAKVRLIDVQLCNSSRWYGGAVHPQDLCAGYPRGGIDTCQGDSGGPLVCKDNGGDYFWLVGLASWGQGCSGAKRPGVFTSTQHYHTWIQVQMGLLPPEADVPPPEPFPTSLEPEEQDSDFSDVLKPNPKDMDNYAVITFQQQILGKFLNLLLELLQFLKGEKA